MTAQDIAEAVLTESPFVGNNGRPRGYLGIVDIIHDMIRTQWAEDILQVDHSEMGRGPNALRWRYAVNRAIPTVLWSGDPSEYPEVKGMVEDWLDRKGLRVVGHTIDFNRWMGY